VILRGRAKHRSVQVWVMTAPSPIPFPAFGKRLRRLRRAGATKQEALAAQIGVNQATISRWESGTQSPDFNMQRLVFDALARTRGDDAALRRLVETSTGCVHLVEDVSHICLAYSKGRARDWKATDRGHLGTSLWPYATDEIRLAESQLSDEGWWDLLSPPPKSFVTSGAIYPNIRISQGGILWERVYLADGTPARLVSGI